MSEVNGKSKVVPEQRTAREPYRPDANTEAIYVEIERGMKSVVREAITQASHFVYLYDADKDADSAVRFVHLIDATECMEQALIHLGQLKSLVDHRMTVRNTQNAPDFDVF